ncbi:MAG: hypothetical protein DMF09_05825 [Verrucomicrobia bacterium]|nr:MAG: hypothetical protein DMF09_05825 [Verrucomicrobiota bacterium]
MLFYVYVLHSRIDNGLYIGYSTNLRKRLKQHWPISPSRHSIAVRGRSSITRCISNKQTPPGRERHLKSDDGRRLLRMQLTHYFTNRPVRSRTRAGASTA